MSQRGGWLLHGVLLDTPCSCSAHADGACSGVGNGFEIAASRDARACVLLRVVSRGLDPAFSAL